MVNYNSIQEIIDAGVNNAECLLKNTYTDTGPIVIDGASWLYYGDAKVNKVYVSGDSYIGINSDSAHISYNNRDASVHYIYREEGVLFGHYRFLRIRWWGCSRFNRFDTTSYPTYQQEFEVIMFETGSFWLHCIQIPSSYYTGGFNYYDFSTSGVVSYTAPTSSTPDVFFYFNTETRAFEVSYNAPDISLDVVRKFLIKNSDALFTVVDDELIELASTELTSSLFVNEGVDKIPNIEILSNLGSFEILLWQSEEFNILPKVSCMFEPFPQNIISSEIDLQDETITGIEKVTVECEGDALIAVSFDEKQTWKAWSNEQWVILTDNFTGMSKETIESITLENWNELYVGATSFYIRVSLVNTDQKMKTIKIDFTN